jgi:tetratricopeptide (TPR) repeat protein
MSTLGGSKVRTSARWRWVLLVTMLATTPHFACGQNDASRQAQQLTAQGNELLRKGNVVRAEVLFKRALAIEERALGPEHVDVAGSLNNLAVLYQNQHRDTDAEALYKRALAILEKVHGPDDPDIATILVSIATIYRNQGRYADAVPLNIRALAIQEKVLGPYNPDIATSLINLAELYRSLSRNADAMPLNIRALAIQEKVLGPDSPDVAETLTNLAALYLDQRRYVDSEPLFKRALAILEKVRGPDDPDIAASLNNLAMMYDEQGRHAFAEPLYKRALEIVEKALGPDNPGVAHGLNNLASAYFDQGRYFVAEPLFKRALAIQEKALGPDHPDVATSLNNLASVYDEQGRYADSEPRYQRALAILEKTLGPDHPNVAKSIINLAAKYSRQGRYADAEKLCKRAQSILEKAFGPDHPDVAASLNNLAWVYHEQGRYADAEKLCKRAQSILEKAFGPDHLEVATSLSDLAEIDRAQGRYDVAEPLYNRALAISEKALGSNHPSIATILHNLALLYRTEGRYADAEPLYKRALAIWEKVLGPDHPDVALSLGDLSWSYYRQNRYRDALQESRRAIAISTGRALQSASSASASGESEQRSVRNYYLQHVAIALALAGEDPRLSQSLEAEAFEAAQWAAGSAAGKALSQAVVRFASGKDSLAGLVRTRQDAVNQWQAADKSLLALLSKPEAEHSPQGEAELRQNLQDLDARLKSMDEAIANNFPAYAELSSPRTVKLSDAQALLAPDEAMLVYTVTDDATYLWTLRGDRSAATKIKIGAKALFDEVQALRLLLDLKQNKARRPFDVERSYALYQKILVPAAPLLEGVGHVIVVLDGALQSLPLGVLVTGPVKAIKDLADYRKVPWFARDHAVTVLPTVSSLRALRQFAKPTAAPHPFVGIGDPVLSEPPQCHQGVAVASLFRGATGDLEAIRKLCSLPEAKEELEALARAEGSPGKDLYLANQATKPKVKSLPLATYRVVAFATHGLVAGDIKNLAEPALVLTPPSAPKDDDDGLLTASDVTQLKLDADWVILSACNTAADDAPGAEGLSGLAKAFFYAGARALLVSHWTVDSTAAAELTVHTLDALRKDKDHRFGRAEALRRAEMAMLDNAALDMAHPMAWAPFSLLGEGSRAVR